MPCHAAMIENPPRAYADQTIGDALAVLEEHGMRHLPVVDAEDVLVGIFSYAILFKNILPVSVSMDGGARMDITVRAAPGIAKRLKAVEMLPVSDIMVRKVPAVHRDTPTWEAIHHMAGSDMPLMVVAHETGVLQGMITGNSAVHELYRLMGRA